METIPFSYAHAYAYVTPGFHGLSYAYVYACAYAYVVRVNQAEACTLSNLLTAMLMMPNVLFIVAV